MIYKEDEKITSRLFSLSITLAKLKTIKISIIKHFQFALTHSQYASIFWHLVDWQSLNVNPKLSGNFRRKNCHIKHKSRKRALNKLTIALPQRRVESIEIVNKTLRRIPRTTAKLGQQLQTTTNHIDSVVAVICDQCQMFDLFIAQGCSLDRVFEINKVGFNQLLVLELWCPRKIQRPEWAGFDASEAIGTEQFGQKISLHICYCPIRKAPASSAP